jgi:hypothetical protein
VIIEHGKFHGVIAPQTPIGWRIASSRASVDAARLLGEELDIGAADIDLAQRFRERLALFGSEDQRKVLAVGDDEVEPFAQNVGALLGGQLGPRRKRALGGFHRLRRLIRAHRRHFCQLDAVGRIADGIGRRADPGAADVALLAQQRGVFQAVLQRWRGRGRACGGGGRRHGVTPEAVLAMLRPSIGLNGGAMHRPRTVRCFNVSSFRDAPPNSGLPEFGNIIVQVGNSRLGCAGPESKRPVLTFGC